MKLNFRGSGNLTFIIFLYDLQLKLRAKLFNLRVKKNSPEMLKLEELQISFSG